jgi:hypothetical protein
VSRQTGFTHRWRIPFDTLNDATWTGQGDTVTVTLGSTAAKWLVDKAAINIKTAFATTGTLTIQVGTDGDPDNFVDAQDAKTAATLLAGHQCHREDGSGQLWHRQRCADRDLHHAGQHGRTGGHHRRGR